ncbi:MAG TPA: competence/damage-inducible protein A [Candidatus Marinimicrobia bacterium]|nr:competence/damage-inducible protein A [Candidatus Neomarinimicrobiota bacterium]HRS51279.1 competence/damage-inducible protein A [Candidatus Neomarinimicrobiota bacterium]HRU91483.1 competence/damage-inducible protein A [Candidatus Neomarinimicrobiota bacterium]
MTNAAIISIGNELISGLVNNTNSTYIARTLNNFGIAVKLIITVGDDQEQIWTVLDNLDPEINLVMITGGLGPTNDDITVSALTSYFDIPLIFNKEIAASLVKRFEKRGLKMPEVNLKQAYLPQGAIILENPVGSAPGLKIEHRDRIYYVLPGVPLEMQAMLTKVIAPQLAALGHKAIGKKYLHITGMPESQIYSLLKEWIEQHPGVKVAFLPQMAQIDLELTIREPQESAKIDEYVKSIQEIIGDNVFGFDDDTLESVIAHLLLRKHLTVAVAESCTGGLVASRLTDVSGSSNYFKTGVVAYSNATKINLLGVEPEIIEKYGAVSSEVANQMANRVRQISGCDLGLSSTGIAGPSGGNDAKPVGLVWIGVSDQNTTRTYQYQFIGDRLTNKFCFSQVALNQLRLYLLGK